MKPRSMGRGSLGRGRMPRPVPSRSSTAGRIVVMAASSSSSSLSSSSSYLLLLAGLLVGTAPSRAMAILPFNGAAETAGSGGAVVDVDVVVTRDNFLRRVRYLSSTGAAAAASAAATSAGISLAAGGRPASASVPPSGADDGSNSAFFHRSPCLTTIESELDAKKTMVGWAMPSSSSSSSSSSTTLSSADDDILLPPVPWSDLRYGASTLSDSRRRGNRVPNLASGVDPVEFPPWMEGTWSARFKFAGASFPQGRKLLTLRVPGAGLGTCLSLPNVGYNPAPFPWKFIRETKTSTTGACYEDLAYNSPRRFEGFWPESKVESVRVGIDDDGAAGAALTPRCYVTGEGCSPDDNPNLRVPSSRVSMDFTGPTRSRGGRATQSLDVSTVGSSSASCRSTEKGGGGGGGEGGGIARFAVARQYAQNDAERDLQTFYKEILSLTPVGGGVGDEGDVGEVHGKMRVAAFLPWDNAARGRTTTPSSSSPSSSSSGYDDRFAVAIYDYKISLTSITEEEASSM